MKKAILFSLLILLTGIYIFSCSNDKKTNPDTEVPTVIITYPHNNSEFETGTIIHVVSEAEDNEEVDNVKLYINDLNSYEDSSEPYEYNWDTTDLSGSHNIYAKATDSSDNTATSELVTVLITNDGEAPTVIITYPQNNSEFETGTIIHVVSEAEDNGEIDNVKFYIDGLNSHEDSSEPYEYNWNTTGSSGSHNIYAEATDSSDNTATSELVTVSIINDGQAPNPPSNPNPVDNASLVFINSNLSWECTDPDGDPLTYDVYLGTSTNPQLMNSGQSETTFNPGTLNENTTYYWKIAAKDDHENFTMSSIWEFTTRDDALFITPIANIQDSISVYLEQDVTIEGVITIGANLLNINQLNAFIQDNSGKGIMLFDYEITSAYEADLIRGNLLQVSGEVDDFYGLTEIKHFSYIIISSGNPDPLATILDMGVNNDNFEGTLVQITGTIYDMYYAGFGVNINVEDEDGNQLTARIWDSTGIDLDEFTAGYFLEARGAGNMYNGNLQILVGYQDHLCEGESE